MSTCTGSLDGSHIDTCVCCCFCVRVVATSAAAAAIIVVSRSIVLCLLLPLLSSSLSSQKAFLFGTSLHTITAPPPPNIPKNRPSPIPTSPPPTAVPPMLVCRLDTSTDLRYSSTLFFPHDRFCFIPALLGRARRKLLVNPSRKDDTPSPSGISFLTTDSLLPPPDFHSGSFLVTWDCQHNVQRLSLLSSSLLLFAIPLAIPLAVAVAVVSQ